MTSLQPSNATPVELALEHAVALITEIPNPIDTLWDPWKCPVAFLPWLAWQYSVDYWRADWPEQIKRQVIDAAYEVHRIKGTLPAIKRAIEGLGVGVEITRWFETEPKGAPYTMTVTVKRPAEGMNAEMQRDLAEMLDASKALRTDAQLRIGAEVMSTFGFASLAAPRQTLSADTPASTRDGAAAGIGFAGGGHAAPRLHAIARAA